METGKELLASSYSFPDIAGWKFFDGEKDETGNYVKDTTVEYEVVLGNGVVLCVQREIPGAVVGCQSDPDRFHSVWRIYINLRDEHDVIDLDHPFCLAAELLADGRIESLDETERINVFLDPVRACEVVLRLFLFKFGSAARDALAMLGEGVEKLEKRGGDTNEVTS